MHSTFRMQLNFWNVFQFAQVYFIKYKAQQEHIASAPIEIPQAPLALSAAPVSSGSAELSLPIQPRKPAAVYGPAN